MFGEEQLGDLGTGDRAVTLAPRDRLALLDRAFHDAQQCEAAEVRRGVEVGDPRLERCSLGVGGCRDRVEQHLAERGEVLARDFAVDDGLRLVEVGGGPAVTARAVHDRELDLVFTGVEVEEQLVDLVDDFFDAGVGAVDLVDRQDHGQVACQRLAQHEARLGQRAFGSIDQQDDAVDHRERTFDLATEVGVAGRVDDVQRDVGVVSLVTATPATCSSRGS